MDLCSLAFRIKLTVAVTGCLQQRVSEEVALACEI